MSHFYNVFFASFANYAISALKLQLLVVFSQTDLTVMLIYCHCDKCYFCSSKERGAEQWFKLYLLNHGGNNVSHAICQYADHRYWILLDTSMEEVVACMMMPLLGVYVLLFCLLLPYALTLTNKWCQQKCTRKSKQDKSR